LGASGAGKSSFMRAGLLPRLARDDRHFLALPIVRPHRAVLFGENGLLRALEGAAAAANLATSLADLRIAIKGGAETLRPLLRQLAGHPAPVSADPSAPGGTPALTSTLVLAIDQGEELFRAEGADEAHAFLTLLRELVSRDDPPLIALFTIRSDDYEPLQSAKELEGLRQDVINLPPMPKGSYSDVINGPALRLHATKRALTLDENLVETLLTDIEEGGSKDALALLAFTLERLYVEYGGRKRMTRTDYRALQAMRGSSEAAVEQAFAQADKDPGIPRDRNGRLALLRRAFIPWLARIDPETRSPRRRSARAARAPHARPPT